MELPSYDEAISGGADAGRGGSSFWVGLRAARNVSRYFRDCSGKREACYAGRMEIDGVLGEGDSLEDAELLREAEEVIERWVAKRVMEGATTDDLRREMNAILADLRVVTSGQFGKA